MYVKKSSHDYYTKWRIQRPERFNALGPVIGNELLNAIDELSKNPELGKKIRMLSISAESAQTKYGPIWIAGGDLKELANLKNAQEAFEYGKTFQAIASKLQALPIPVVFAVNGKAIGGGVEFILGGDLRIATKHSSFHFKQTAVGLATGYGGSTLLKELVGHSRASGWLFMNSTISATEALREGLIHKVVEDESQLDQELSKMAEGFAQQSPEGLAAQKSMLNQNSDERSQSLARELELFKSIWRNPSHEEFLKKYSTKA